MGIEEQPLSKQSQGYVRSITGPPIFQVTTQFKGSDIGIDKR